MSTPIDRPVRCLPAPRAWTRLDVCTRRRRRRRTRTRVKEGTPAAAATPAIPKARLSRSPYIIRLSPAAVRPQPRRSRAQCTQFGRASVDIFSKPRRSDGFGHPTKRRTLADGFPLTCVIHPSHTHMIPSIHTDSPGCCCGRSNDSPCSRRWAGGRACCGTSRPRRPRGTPRARIQRQLTHNTTVSWPHCIAHSHPHPTLPIPAHTQSRKRRPPSTTVGKAAAQAVSGARATPTSTAAASSASPASSQRVRT